MVASQTRTAWVLTTAVGVACTVVAAVGAGSPGAVAGVLGTVAVLGFFLAGLTPVTRAGLLERGSGLALGVVLVGYVVRLVAVLALVVLVAAVADVDRRSLGLTVMACALAWVTGAAVVALRGHVPLDVPDHGAPGA